MTNERPKSERSTLTAQEAEVKSGERLRAELNMSSAVRGALTVREFGCGGPDKFDIAESVDEMARQVERVHRGDLSGVESMLTAQAVSLDSVFNELATRAAENFGRNMSTAETYLRLALKAQSQCRATLETLAEVKYPKAATFIKQANIAERQQVNNGKSVETDGHVFRASEKQITPDSELLEQSNEKRVVTGKKSKASSAD